MLLVYQKNIQDATRQLEMTRAEIMKCRAEVEASQHVASPLAALTEKKAMQTIDVDKFRTLISKLQVIDTLNTQRPVSHTMYSTPCAPHPVFHTVHCTLFTLHHTPYTPCPAPYFSRYTCLMTLVVKSLHSLYSVSSVSSLTPDKRHSFHTLSIPLRTHPPSNTRHSFHTLCIPLR
jgi:hypothetical protein